MNRIVTAMDQRNPTRKRGPNMEWTRTMKIGGRRQASTAVELALILPFLVLFMLGAVDFGRFAYFYLAVTNGARTGAGVGSEHLFTPGTLSRWEGKIREAVIEELAGMPGFEENNVTITLRTTQEADDLWQAAVTVHYPFKTAVNWPTLKTSVELGHTVTF
ncbi:MAG: TadE family protein [Bdellovibrionales bacterium]